MFSPGSTQLIHLPPRKAACLPSAPFVTLVLFLALSVMTACGSPLAGRLIGPLLDQKQLFFRLLFASRAFSMDLARALASHLLREARSAVRVSALLLPRHELERRGAELAGHLPGPALSPGLRAIGPRLSAPVSHIAQQPGSHVSTSQVPTCSATASWLSMPLVLKVRPGMRALLMC